MAYEDRRPRLNVSGELSVDISALDTTISSTAFTTLPTIYSNAIYMPLTITDSAGNAEVVFVVGHASGSTALTVVRNREGTTARSFKAGDRVRCTPTPWDTQRVGGHAGQIGSFTSLTTGGVVIPLAGQDLYGGCTVTGNALVLPVAGLWRIGYRFYISGGTPGYQARVAVRRNGTVDAAFPAVFVPKPDSLDQADYVQVQRRLAANDALSLMGYGSAGSAYGSTGYDGAYIEAELVQQQ